MKVRRKFTNFIFMQDIRQINSKVNDFRMKFFLFQIFLANNSIISWQSNIILYPIL